MVKVRISQTPFLQKRRTRTQGPHAAQPTSWPDSCAPARMYDPPTRAPVRGATAGEPAHARESSDSEVRGMPSTSLGK